MECKYKKTITLINITVLLLSLTSIMYGITNYKITKYINNIESRIEQLEKSNNTSTNTTNSTDNRNY